MPGSDEERLLPGLHSVPLGAPAVSTSASPRRGATDDGASAAATAATTARLASAAMAHISRLCMSPLQSNVFLLVNPTPDTAGITPESPLRQHQQQQRGGAEGAAAATSSTEFQRTDTASTTDSESRPAGSSLRIPAHRAILAAASPTFAAMFASGMQECADGAEVFVPYTLPVMESVLAFVYCDAARSVASITSQTAMEVLDAACFYQLEPLKQAAIDTVVDLTSNDTVLPVLSAAVRYGSDRLKDHCIGFIRQHNTDVLGSRFWPLLPLEVAVLLVRETVINSELELLRSCIAWCRAHANNADDGGDVAATPTTPTAAAVSSAADTIKGLLASFLPFINFTAMTMAEMAEVERLGCIPIEVLYKAFKSHALGGEPTWTARHGGILLQWEYHGSGQLAVNNNHVAKVSQNFDPVTITAMNRFAAGSHYWYFTVAELRTKHDCLIGIRSQRRKSSIAASAAASAATAASSPLQNAVGAAATATACDYDVEIKYEPCCNTVTAIPSSGLRVVRSPECPDTVLGADHGCVIGVCVDFDSAQVRFYDHLSKRHLYTVEAVDESSARTTATPPALVPDADDAVDDVDEAAQADTPATPPPVASPTTNRPPVAVGVLPTPLFPCATLYHRGNGGVILSDTTTYLGERGVAPADVHRGDSRPESAMGTPKKLSNLASAGSSSGSPFGAASSLSIRSPSAGPAAHPSARPPL